MTSTPAIVHAQLWLRQGRADRAEPELRRALVENPDDSTAHALLALCLVHLERAEEAVDEARAAIRAEPDGSFGHYALAVVLEGRGRIAEAREAIDTAIRIDPRDAGSWAVRGQIELGDRRWSEAREAGERALALDPEHVGAANVRARALAQLGLAAETEDELRRTLARDPENAMTHANHGWWLLQRGKPKEAGESFGEALRLEPGNESARSGLVESLKARNRLYRAMLGYFFWMGRLSRRSAWMVVAAVFFLPRVLRGAAQQVPALEPVVLPITVALVGFVFMTWIIEPLFDASLFLHPLGRHALTARERRRALGVAALLAGGVACGLIAWLGGLRGAWAPAVGLLTFTIPLSAAMSVEGRTRRRVASRVTIGLAVAAAVAIAANSMALREDGRTWMLLALPFALLYIAGVFVMSLLANRWAMSPLSD